MKAMIRRMCLKSKGYSFDRNFEYKMELVLSNRDQGNKNLKNISQVNNATNNVLDVVVTYHAGNKQQLWFGKTKLSGNRERVISSMNLSEGLGATANTTEYTLGFTKNIVDQKLKVHSVVSFIDQESEPSGNYRVPFQIEIAI